MRTHGTANDLNANAKQAAIELLNERVAEGIDLALLTKQAHWNLKGPQFVAVHEMLDGFRGQIDTHVDTMAERVVQLGGTALGTTQAVAKSSALPPYPIDIYAIKDHLAALIERTAQWRTRCGGASMKLLRPVMRTPPTSLPLRRATWTKRCGSWKHTSRRRLDPNQSLLTRLLCPPFNARPSIGDAGS
jgi:starvation-inducible DNA-binding protein